MNIRNTLLASALLLGAGSTGVLAQESAGAAGSFQLRLRAVTVAPDPSATILINGANIGGTTDVSTSVIPEADLSYFVTDNIALEVIAAVTRHTVSNSVAGRVSSVSLLPPTVTAQYHFDPKGWIRPYVGAGINYTLFYDPASALPQIKFRNRFGWALQAGMDIPLGDGPYFLNFDVKKLFLDTRILANGGAVNAKASLDPWLIGTGFGIRF